MSSWACWAALCPLGSLLVEELRRTLFWIVGFVVLLAASALLQPHLAPAHLPEAFVTWFFVLNVGAVIAVMLTLVAFSVPLYRLFCAATGFGGTTQRAAAALDQVGEQVVTVRFATEVESLARENAE